MTKLLFAAEAPSNIALIKYMGKSSQEGERNVPVNASLSYTLEHLRTRVELQPLAEGDDRWVPLDHLQHAGWMAPRLSDLGQKKFLAHLDFLRQRWGLRGAFQVASANNFPSDCGIASSASSFAALTLAAYEALRAQRSEMDLSLADLSLCSRHGSGSSIRSFFQPLALWDASGAHELAIPCPIRDHEVILVDAGKKAVSSSEAHMRVTTSPLFEGRAERAEQRLAQLMAAFESSNWESSWQICWDEFQDMHALFETANPPFHYRTDESRRTLDVLLQLKQEGLTMPLVTMDAGANIHLLYGDGQVEARERLHGALSRHTFLTPGATR